MRFLSLLKRLWAPRDWWEHEGRLRDYMGWCHWHGHKIDSASWSEYLAGKAHPQPTTKPHAR